MADLEMASTTRCDSDLGKASTSTNDSDLGETSTSTVASDLERQASEPKRLGPKKTAGNMTSATVAIGVLAIPYAFAKLGMIAGTCVCIIDGIIATYGSEVVVRVTLDHPEITSFAGAVGLLWGKHHKIGCTIALFMVIAYLNMLTGAHALFGAQSFGIVFDSPETCDTYLGVAAAGILFLCALTRTFHDFTWFSYIGLSSVISTLMIGLVGLAVKGIAAQGGTSNWSWGIPADTTWESGIKAAVAILFAFSWVTYQITFQNQMKEPEKCVKSIRILGTMCTFVYTLTGALFYWLAGDSVASLALLSVPQPYRRAAFAVAWPVIFISGGLTTILCARSFLDQVFPKKQGRYSRRVWILTDAVLTTTAFVIAETIPVFGALLGLMGSLFVAPSTCIVPALFWFMMVKKGRWYERKNLMDSTVFALMFMYGLFLMSGGTYVAMKTIIEESSKATQEGRGPFSCTSAEYRRVSARGMIL